MHTVISLLQAEGAQGAADMSWVNWLFLGSIIFIFYFFMIRPQSKRQKEEKVFRESLSKGDKVSTIGGIYGKVVTLEEHTVILQIDDNTKVRIDKAALKASPDPKQAEKAKA